MYTRQELSRQRQAFWTAFGQYMRPVPGADGHRVNWVNYKTGVHHIFFRMDAGSTEASIAIEITHTDAAAQRDVYDKFLALRTVLHSTLSEDWQWSPAMPDEAGHIISRIGTTMSGASIGDPAHWPQLISFFKSRIMALDEFWSMVRPGFE